MLYELLTGQRPYEVKAGSLEEIVRTVCETDPQPPSAAMFTVAGPKTARPGIAAHRLRGDIDTIVLKALRKEPERRYPSVLELSEDVRRPLEGRPVTARRDSPGYRAGRFVQRNRLAVAAALTVLASLLAGLVATSWQAREARRERDAAERARSRNETLIEF